MRLLIFGLSITSSWGNGHATVYRGLAKALHRVGVTVAFVEKEVPWYASNRDLWECDYAAVRLYQDAAGLEALLVEELPGTDTVLVGSYFPDGIVLTDMLARRRGLARLFYDIDTPVTLGALAAEGTAGYLRADQIPAFDAVLSFTGGPALRELEERWGARRAVAFYCALDPDAHRRTAPDERFVCTMGYMGTYSADRQAALEVLFLRPAKRMPEHRFVLAGPQYPPMPQKPDNIIHFQHLSPSQHSAFYSSCRLSLNITRGPMVAYGHSPSVRLFEAAGCAACTVSDQWSGIEEVFEVGTELLVGAGEDEMVEIIRRTGPDEVKAIGERARARALRDHTYDVRAKQLMELLGTL